MINCARCGVTAEQPCKCNLIEQVLCIRCGSVGPSGYCEWCEDEVLLDNEPDTVQENMERYGLR